MCWLVSHQLRVCWCQDCLALLCTTTAEQSISTVCLSVCNWIRSHWKIFWLNHFKSYQLSFVFAFSFFLNFHWFGCDFKQIGQQSFVAKIIRLAHSNKGYYWELVHSQIKKFCWDQYMSDHIASCKWLRMEYATIFVLKNINICHKTKTLIILPKISFQPKYRLLFDVASEWKGNSSCVLS